jgi:hypothetical protein
VTGGPTVELVKLSKDRWGDLAIHLIGAGIVGVIVWFASTAAERLHVSLVVVVIVATAVSISVVGLVFVVVQSRQLTRTQSKLGVLQQTAAVADKTLRDLRNAHVRIAEQLQVADEWTTREVVAAYTVDPGGNDRSETVCTLAFKGSDQGRVFTVEDSTAPLTNREVVLTCDYSATGSIVIPVLVEDEPSSKKWAIHLHPPVGNTPRQLEIKQTWPGFWDDLRQTGADYYELTARPGLQKAQIIVYIPVSLGEFEWGPSPTPQVGLTRSVAGTQQTLTMTVSAPVAGQRYRVDIVKKKGRT